jgi:hypothetical protein
MHSDARANYRPAFPCTLASVGRDPVRVSRRLKLTIAAIVGWEAPIEGKKQLGKEATPANSIRVIPVAAKASEPVQRVIRFGRGRDYFRRV